MLLSVGKYLCHVYIANFKIHLPVGSCKKIELCSLENPLKVFFFGEIGIIIFYNFKVKVCKGIPAGNIFFGHFCSVCLDLESYFRNKLRLQSSFL